MKAPLYAAIARRLVSIRSLKEANRDAASPRTGFWLLDHYSAVRRLVREHLPSGSGVDNGCELDEVRSTPERLVIHTAFHHMDENGSYDGWTEHTVTVKPSLAYGIDVVVSGRDRNGIKEYLGSLFVEALTSEVEEFPATNAAEVQS